LHISINKTNAYENQNFINLIIILDRDLLKEDLPGFNL
jgi:hypothetical protein